MESVPHLSSHDGPGRVQADGLLAADVVAYADGGGHTQTFTRPVYGRERIARLVPGFETWLQLPGAEEMRLAEVNGQPGAVSSARMGGPC